MRNNKIIIGILLAMVTICSCNPTSDVDSQTISLKGEWKFRIDPEKQGENEKWFTQELPDTVQLPGSMDENKKGTPVVITSARHLNRQYEYEGVAWYQKKVVIPQEWDKKHISLFIERAHWSSKVWVDDKRVPGIQESLSVPHRHNLSDYLTPGEHTITVTIDNTIRFALGGHAYSKNTQTNWNGMTGCIELQAKDPVWVKGVNIYPDVTNKTAKVNIKLQSILEADAKGLLTFFVDEKLLEKEVEIPANNTTEISVDLQLSHDIQLWDDFSPTLHKLDVQLAVGEEYNDAKSLQFGMREVSNVDNRIALNGIPVFLRGNVENCEFPLTGYLFPLQDQKI